MKKIALLLGALTLALTFSLAEADMENDTNETAPKKCSEGKCGQGKCG